MENLEIADTVLCLCENNGYSCFNLYRGIIEYARAEGRALDEYFAIPTRQGIWHCGD